MSRSIRCLLGATVIAATGIVAGLLAAPAMAEEWTGNRLTVSGAGIGTSNCPLRITRVYGGSTLSPVWITITSTAPAGGPSYDITAGTLKIAGGANSKTGGLGFHRVPANSTVEQSTNVSLYGGSMAGTTVTINVTGCTRAN